MRLESSSALLGLTLLVACGDDAQRPIDAGSDGTVTELDAAPPDALVPAPTTVRAHDGANGIAGLPVAFLGPDESVISVTTTNGDGEASAIVPEGGQAVLASADGRTAFLWQGLHATGGTLEAFFDTYDTMTVIVPAGPTAGSYEVATPCGGGGGGSTTVALSFLRRGCTSADVVVTWAANGMKRGFHVTGQPLVAGTTLDLSAQTYGSEVMRSMTFTGVASASQTLIDIDLLVPGAVGPVLVGGPANNVGTAPGDVSIGGVMPDLSGALLQSTIGQISGQNARKVVRLGPTTETTFAPSLHWLPDTGPATFDAFERRIRWSQGTGGQPPQGAIIWFFADRGAAAEDVFWQIATPGPLPSGDVSTRIPPLPVELAAIDLGATATAQGAIDITTISVSGGFRALRDRAFGRYGWLLLDGEGTAATARNRPFL